MQNIVILAGNIGQAPEARTTQGCVSACKIDPLRRGIGVQF
jgi:single-stranded DNA-binding protein